MSNNLTITSSPHFRSSVTTQALMRDVLIALLPALAASVYYFGVRALIVSAVCVAASVLFEYLYRKMLNLSNTVGDLSAAVTGLLIGFNVPSSLPLWMAVIGCFAAVVIVKQLFGGLGKNFANPAIVGRIVMLVSFSTPMTKWPMATDAVTAATPLSLTATDPVPSYLDLFLGRNGGSIGETCAVALIIGGIYLVARGVITLTTPVTFLATVAVMSVLLGGDPLYQVLSGGLLLGAFFMATDYTTSPTTERGKIIFGIGCGLITAVIRFYGSYPEGVSFAILLMNIITPHIDRLTPIKAFGGVQAK